MNMQALTLRLRFSTNTNEFFNINLRRPSSHLTAETVNDAMDDIIASGAVNTNGRGDLAKKEEAFIRFTQHMDFDIN